MNNFDKTKLSDFEKLDFINDQLLETFNIMTKKDELNLIDFVFIGFIFLIYQRTGSFLCLIENKLLDSIDLLARSTFEIYVQLLFILKSDTQKRIESYLLSCDLENFYNFDELYATIKRLEKCDPNNNYTRIMSLKTSIESQLYKITSENQYNHDKTQLINKYKSYFPNNNSNKPEKILWYNYNTHVNNFKKLCEEVGKLSDYLALYSFLSKENHNKNIKTDFHLTKNNTIKFRSHGNNITSNNLMLNMKVQTKYIDDVIIKMYDYYNYLSEKKMYESLKQEKNITFNK